MVPPVESGRFRATEGLFPPPGLVRTAAAHPMVDDATHPSPRALEAEVRRLWTARRLPAAGGVVGRADGPLVRQMEGSFAAVDPPELVAPRAVAADVDARFLALSGRGALGTLRRVATGDAAAADRVGPLLESLGVWVGGGGEHPWDAGDRRAAMQQITARLAHAGLIAVRDGPIRHCLTCRRPRTPERIVYQKEIGDTLLVRFPVAGSDPPVEALVWVDAPWRLLGASALLVHPDVPYAVVDFQRRGATVTLLVSRGSLDRLREWLPDVELTVREERPGREWVGKPYTYPLRHEFPVGGSLEPPGGTIQADTDVGDTGTGIVPLVPGHGPTDADIAERLGISGWPLLTPRGFLDPSLMHKYAGLDLETANEFVARDLTDGGAVLARLRVVRGVPYCAVCGHTIVWVPGRAWCLEPGNLPAEQRDRYVRLLPHDRPVGQIEIARWPISEATTTAAPDAVTLLECNRCERLEAPDGPPECPCGGSRRPVGRRLLIAIAGAFGAWGRIDPLPPADSIRLYANDRRRVPVVVHNLTAMAGIDASTTDLGLTVVPTVSRVDLGALLNAFGADAVRSAFVRSTVDDHGSGPFEERCRQEAHRLARLVADATAVVARCEPALVREGAQPPDPNARDLEPEDRAILAVWGRDHLQLFTAFERWNAAAAHRRLFGFVERDLARYARLVRPRLDASAPAPSRRAALRTLLYLYRSVAVAVAPIAPFTAESIHRKFLREPRSLFEGVDLQADRGLVDEGWIAAWARWAAISDALDHYRRSAGLAPAAPLETVVANVGDELLAEKLRTDRPTIERIAGVGRFDAASPKVPWNERRREVRPVEREIQRAYPAVATQIVHLLERLPPRRPADVAGRELTVFVNGVPRQITPEMVVTVDTIPSDYAPTPFALGELYVRHAGSAAAGPPPLSPDAFWLVRRLARRLRAGGPDTARRAIVVAVDPLAAELKEKGAAIAAFLGLGGLDVVDQVEETLPLDRISGRTRTGARWWVAVPGGPAPLRRAKRRAAVSDRRRVRPPVDAPADQEIDYADDRVVQEIQSIRALGQELDALFGAPLLGPAKIAIAWQAGLRTRAEFEAAPFDQVARLPGFGRPVAALLWERTGRAAPASPARTRRSTPANGHGASVPPAVPPVLPEAGRPAPSPSIPLIESRPPPTVSPPAESDVAAPIVVPASEPAVTSNDESALAPIPAAAPSQALMTLPVSTLPSVPATVAVEPSSDRPPSGVIQGEPEATPASPPPGVEDAGGVEPAPAAGEDVGESPGRGSDAAAVVPAEETTELAPGPVHSPPTGPNEGDSALASASGAGASDGPPEEAGAIPPAIEPQQGAPAAVEVTTADDDTLPEAPPLPEESSAALPVAAAATQTPVASPAIAPLPEAPVVSEPESPDVPDAAPTEAPDHGMAVVPPEPSSESAVPPSPAVTPADPDVSISTETAPEPPAIDTPVPEPSPTAVPALSDQPVARPVSPTVVESPLPPTPPPPPSGLEIGNEPTLFGALQPFLDVTGAGHRGLAIVRELPDRIRAHVGPRPVEVLWLSNLDRPMTLRPSDLDDIERRVRRAFDEEGVTAVFLEGVEYLVRIHGVEKVAAFLRATNAAARARLARVWLHVTPGLLTASDLERIEAIADEPPSAP